jgi:hypothetical protein
MPTPRSAETQRDDNEFAVIRPAGGLSLLVLAANFARYHLFFLALSASCLAVGLWLYWVPVERRHIDRIRRAHACFYACMAFFVLQFVSMFLA